MTLDVLHDGLCTATWRSRRGDFVSLMTLYESNYVRLRALTDDVFALPEFQVSRRANDVPLHLRVIERSPYTITLSMTYRFVEHGDAVSDPDLQVRVYRDARLAEALSCPRWRRHSVLKGWRNAFLRHMDARWQRNMMLNKWLEYCADRGHRFGAPALSAG